MITQKFKEEYSKLNKKQKEAVDTIEGPVMVVAGPGTGKTTILTLRIANILKETDTPASGILALTFTESGVKAMKNKLREIIGDKALEVPIHTFHGFAASVISEFDEHFPDISKRKQITDIETETLMREILIQKKFWKLRPIGAPDFYISKILSAISESKQEAWTPDMLRSFAIDEIERIKNDPDSISQRGSSKGQIKADALKKIEKCERTIIFADVYEDYENKKVEQKKKDYDDLIFELLNTLRTDKLLLQILQEKYLYILLDEHQDSNDAQNLIVKIIADFFDNPNVFIVGDDKQAIYRFQGASVENFLGFQKIWKSMKIISLVDNYRSHQYILDASFKMIENNYEENAHTNLRIKLKSSKPEEGPLEIAFAPDVETEEINLIKKLKELQNQETTIAVIVRKNSEVSKIFSLLEKNSIKASAERGIDIFSHPIGILFFSLIEFLLNPDDTAALAETIVGGLWKIDFETQVKLLRAIKKDDFDSIKKLINLSGIQKNINEYGALEYLIFSAEESGLTEIVSKSPVSSEVWRNIFSLARDLTSTNNIEDPKKLIKEMLAYKTAAEKRTLKIKTGEVSSNIIVMTAHSSKGLEFDYVFLPFATEESWIRKNHSSYFALPKEKDNSDDIKDERRLFYVAITRAKKHVCISLSKEDSENSLTPLRFIDELDQKFISKTELTKMGETEILYKNKDKQSSKNKEKIEFAKRVILENGLSVTALNHFLKCPSEFFYKSILKLPEAPSASSEKGTAMHEALANVWKITESKNKEKSGKIDSKVIEKTITKSVSDYFKNSLLSKHEKEIVLEELIKNAPKVSTSLEEHFNQKGEAKTESWVELPFSKKIESENVEISIHGRLDATIEQDDKVLVFDYKTKETMSQNAIMGETKSSDDNYFRQLIFYKILLEENPKFKNKVVEPALVFVKPDKNGKCPTVSVPISKAHIEKTKKEISELLDSVWSGKFLTQTCDDETCKYCKMKNLTV